MTAVPTLDSAPDWSQTMTEFACPLCEYNLRGLVDPRCPECGFAFRWTELIDGMRNKHPYLFEHQNKRNIWSFLKTYWHDSRPRQFWRDLNPAQPVNVRRLLIYWTLCSCVPFFVLMIPQPLNNSFHIFGELLWTLRMQTSGNYGGMILSIQDVLSYRFGARLLDRNSVGSGCLLIIWPMLTTATLMIFRVSMKQANISPRHVLRCVLYGCDFGFLVLLVTVSFAPHEIWSHADLSLMGITGLCAVVATYRIGFAYSRYLRFHRPWATVLASQTIVLLFLFTVCLWVEMSF